jgi:hypothetical protein
VRIEQLTLGKVGRRELRPHDWQQWWPRELAETTNPASAVEVAHV